MARDITARNIILIVILTIVLAFILFFAMKPKHVEIQDPVVLPDGQIREVSLEEIKANLVGGGPAKDGIPSIDNPRYVNAIVAQLKDDDTVVGIVRGEKAYAYPQRILYWHEVVNDEIDGEKISVTYCPLTGSFIGFKNAELGVSGKLYNSNLVMYDRATGSNIPQILATAIDGPIKGDSLEQIPVVVTTWAKWKAVHPNTQVLSFETGIARDYDRSPYPGYEDALRIWFPVAAKSDKFKSKERMVVAMIGDTPIAVQKELMRTKRSMSILVGDSLIEASYDETLDHVTFKDGDGNDVINFETYWFAWFAYHPDTAVME